MPYKRGRYSYLYSIVMLFLFMIICNNSFSQNPKIKCYFNHPVNNSLSTGVNAVYLNGTFPDTIVAYINRAKYTLDIALYNFSSTAGDALSKLATAINNAKQRGVKVRWVYDGSSSNSGLKLLDTSIHTIGSPTTIAYGIMHNKFIVFDVNSPDSSDPVVLSGSYNWTSQQTSTDYNNIIFIQNKDVAQLYYTEFNKMWGGIGIYPDTTLSTFGPKKSSSKLHNFNVNGTNVSVYFSPKDTLAKYIKNVVSTSTKELFFGIYAFTDNAIANLINTKLNSGVNVRGIMDNFSKTYTPYTTLNSTLGANMILYNGAGLFHSKIMLKDALHPLLDPQVFTGSFNWSTSAETSNDENAVIVHEPFIANQYYQSLCQNFIDMGGSACISPMPVEFVSFKASIIDRHSNYLEWVTANEINNQQFVVERSYDKIHFESIGIVESKGDNISAGKYSFTDQYNNNATAFYRLKQIDKNGGYEYSFVVSVTNNVKLALEVFPNPVQSTLQINFPLNTKTIKIFDGFGRAIKEINVERLSSLILNVEQFAVGKYIIEADNMDNHYVQSFLKL